MVIGFKKEFVAPIQEGVKKHTLRDCDPDNHRWKPGMTMHMATGVRTKNYNCFKQAPFISSQRVLLIYYSTLEVLIDNRKLSALERDQFAKADGFEDEFVLAEFFFPKGEGDVVLTLLHWTDLRY